LSNPVKEIESNAFPLFLLSDFVSSEAKTMGLSDTIRDRAMAISENHDIKNLFSGRQANVGAAVILAFAASRENYDLSSGHYARIANISRMTFVSSLKEFLKFVEDMSKRGELPLPFRAAWNYPNYILQ
jgi:transcription initiation factor TFIIIB Brf1 subunit/transcription initiation factor TFIIB